MVESRKLLTVTRSAQRSETGSNGDKANQNDCRRLKLIAWWSGLEEKLMDKCGAGDKEKRKLRKN